MLRANWSVCFFCFSTTFLFIPGLSFAAETAQHTPVGVARIDITPDFPVRLAGYAGRTEEANEVAERLWGKALAIGGDEKAGEGPAVLIMLESCSATTELATELAARLKEKAGIRPERCVVVSTHDHSAPQLPEYIMWHYTAAVPPENLAHMQQYRRFLADRLEKVALDALAARKPALLSWSSGEVDFGANRRVIKDGKWFNFLSGDATQSPGPVDHRLPVLRVTDTEGKLLCLVASYACHCTTTSGSFNAIHGDWAGYAQKQIEKDHPGAMAMITIGCGGDVGPYPNGTLALAEQHGNRLAQEVDRLLKGEWKPISADLIARRKSIQVPLGRLPSREDLQRQADDEGLWLGARDAARHFLGVLDGGGKLPQSFDYPVTTWTFGDDLTMVFLPGEVTIDYALRLQRELDGSRLWVTAYANGMPCYIASKRLLDEGGYEADSSMYSYGQPTRLAPEAEDAVIGAVRSLISPSFGGKETK